MIFNSLTYLIFLNITFFLYWFTPQRFRVQLICIASIIFYGFWHPEFLLLMLLSTGVDYWVALKIYATNNIHRKRLLLLISLIINLGLLLYFKYLLFVLNNLKNILDIVQIAYNPPNLTIILPLAISFYTFEAISYIVDVYRNQMSPERNFWKYWCFITFFPKLIAGPILRAADIIPQISKKISFNTTMVAYGLHRIILGLFLKVCVADNLSPLVEAGFNTPKTNLSAIDVWTLAFLFGFQIYFDFSAYSSIAIGSASLFGIKLLENFNFPYVASSPKEFWKRWHISLSKWIRDYLYIPLQNIVAKEQLNKKIKTNNNLHPKSYLVLFLTWGIMGLWHGANWNFLIWGVYHAILIAIHRLISKIKLITKIPASYYLGWSVTLPLIMLGWIPFRTKNLEETFVMWLTVFSPKDYFWLGMRENTYLITATLLILFIINKAITNFNKVYLQDLKLIQFIFQIVFYSILIFFVIVFLRPINQYIYFQF